MDRFALWVQTAGNIVSSPGGSQGHTLIGDFLIHDSRVPFVEFTGKGLILAPTVRISHDLALGTAHIHNVGSCWFVRPPIPSSPPYLVSNDFSLQVAFQGPVSFRPADWAKKALGRRPEQTILVAGTQWVGALTYKKRGWLSPTFTWHLIAFGSGPDMPVYETVTVIGTTSDPFGQIQQFSLSEIPS